MTKSPTFHSEINAAIYLLIDSNARLRRDCIREAALLSEPFELKLRPTKLPVEVVGADMPWGTIGALWNEGNLLLQQYQEIQRRLIEEGVPPSKGSEDDEVRPIIDENGWTIDEP